jgi:molecular chaperone GrpE
MCNEDRDQTINEQDVQSSDTPDPLTTQLQACLVLQQEWKDRFLRTTAEFENYKRRQAREQSNWIEHAEQKVFLELLPIIDDFDRALQQSFEGDGQVWVEGIQMIRASLAKVLHKWGIEVMKNYTLFDPMHHEAIAQAIVPGKEPGTIIEIIKNGYLWKDKVLRPAQVVVAQ